MKMKIHILTRHSKEQNRLRIKDRTGEREIFSVILSGALPRENLIFKFFYKIKGLKDEIITPSKSKGSG